MTSKLTKVTKRVATKKTASVRKKTTTKPKPISPPNLILEKEALKKVSKILICQPPPDSGKSVYLDLAQKYNIAVDFAPFIRVEGVDSKEFRKQRINFQIFTAVIFTSRNAIDHYFRIANDLKVKISPNTKYFCTSESVALYLQKFIVYRKRKVLYGDDMSFSKWADIIKKNAHEKFLFPYSNIQYQDIIECLKTNHCFFKTAEMYRIVSNDIKDKVLQNNYDMICLFTPGGIKSLFDNIPDFKKNNDTLICVYGYNSAKIADEKKLPIDLIAPTVQYKSVYEVLDKYLSKSNPIV